MFNPDGLEKLVKSVIKLAGSHPWLSVPILVCAIALALSIGAKTDRKYFGWVIDIVKGGTWQERITLGAIFSTVPAGGVSGTYNCLSDSEDQTGFRRD